MPADPTHAVADPPLSDDVRAFCQRHDLLDHLGRAIELARHHFAIVGEPAVGLEQDPEDGECYLVLEISVQGKEDVCIQAQKRYIRAQATTANLPELHMISLVCRLSE